MSSVRIAIYQAQSGIDPAANAERLVGAVRDAAAGGAAMLFTPEMSGMLDRDRERALGKARHEEDDQVLAAVREAAAGAGIWVHLGSLALKAEGGKLVNRGFVMDNGGEVRARYDKIHLFDVDLPTGESWRESAMYEAGASAVIVPGRSTPMPSAPSSSIVMPWPTCGSLCHGAETSIVRVPKPAIASGRMPCSRWTSDLKSPFSPVVNVQE